MLILLIFRISAPDHTTSWQEKLNGKNFYTQEESHSSGISVEFYTNVTPLSALMSQRVTICHWCNITHLLTVSTGNSRFMDPRYWYCPRATSEPKVYKSAIAQSDSQQVYCLYAFHKIVTKFQWKTFISRVNNHNRRQPQLPFTTMFQTSLLKTKY